MKSSAFLAIGLGALFLSAPVWAIAPDKSDPLYQSKGDHKRNYRFAPTGEILPYRIYVPSTWSPNKKLPLVLVLHGGGLTEDAPFERTPAPMRDELQKLAEEFGYIVVSPSGYSENGGFGAPPPPGAPGGPPLPGGGAMTPPPMGGPGTRPGGPPLLKGRDLVPNKTLYSAQDVMNVVDLVEQEYGVDKSREFITGNSMGAIGTVFLVTQNPGKWLAMAPSEGGYHPSATDSKYGVKGALFIHAQNDRVPAVETDTAAMLKILAAQGVDARAVSVPNSMHENVWFLALPITFHFFDKFVQGP